MTNPRTKDYDIYNELSIEELAQKIGDVAADSSLGRLMRIVYEQKVIKRQFEYNKQQIELQHQKNTELVKEQVKWVKCSAILTAVATLSAAIAGSLVTYMLTRPTQQSTTRTETQQISQPHSETSTSASRPEKIPDKVPSSSPPK